MTKFYRARETFIVATPAGQPPVTVKSGRIVKDSDPLLTGRESLFEEIDAAAARDALQAVHRAGPAPVEQATAAPGERRPTRRVGTDG